ncbi:MAG: Arylsulfatase [Chloroflexi bacterium ADurb.Bin325]|nr:MAG: Arylsulfatase [Chloroflexi bacterium ADurb.Bin325]
MSNLHPHQPNILFILADDQGAWALGCAGNSEIRTPNLDRLAATGTRCENFFCASPVCSPARASILTGRIPSQHGVHDWLRAGNYAAEGPSVEYLQGQPGYTDFLAAAGYTCGLSGKWHLGDSYRAQKGFSYWAVHATGGGPYYGAPMIGGPLLRPEAVREGELYAEPRYVTDVITDNALAFLETQAGAGRPFYLGVHYTAPHSPWDRDNHPTELYDGYRRDCPFESIPRLDQKGQTLAAIGGLPPNLLRIPEGCAFNPRCRMAQDICRQERPELREIQPGRHSACHFAEEVIDA